MNRWGLTACPSPTITGHMGVTRSPSGTQAIYLNAIASGNFIFRPCDNPRQSTVAKNGIGSQYSPDLVNISVDEGAVLQSYPRGTIFAGGKADQQLQVGNAVPPLVAEAVLNELWS